MELQTAIEILEYHQEWRLGRREDMIHDPKKLTGALDIVLSEVKKFRLKMTKETIKEQAELLGIKAVGNCEVWKPTMILRWLETDNYSPINDGFDRVLQQKWQSGTGEEKWEDIEVYGR